MAIRGVVEIDAKARSVSNTLRAFRHRWRGDFRGGLTWWSASALVAVALTALPLVVIVFGVFGRGSEMWGHLVDTVLPVYVGNSFILMLGVGAWHMAAIGNVVSEEA